MTLALITSMLNLINPFAPVINTPAIILGVKEFVLNIRFDFKIIIFLFTNAKKVESKKRECFRH